MDSSTDRPAASNEKKQTVFERLYNNNREKEERRRRLAAEVVGVELRECTYMPVINSAEGGMLSSASYHSISTISHREIKVERIKEKYLQGEICDGCFKGMEIGTGTFYIEDFVS